MNVYLDTSAALKTFAKEPESMALRQFLEDLPAETAIVSSVLLETELRRATMRLHLEQEAATRMLSGVRLIEFQRAFFHQAGLMPGTGLRSLDALHLVTALHADAGLMIAYDRRLLEAARSVGLECFSPAA